MIRLTAGPRSRANLGIFLSLIAACFLVSCATMQTQDTGATKAGPGKYTKWNGLIDELEVVQNFSIGKYSKTVLLPIETASTPLPEKDDNTYEPVTKVLAQIDSVFTEGLKSGLKDLPNISMVSAQAPGSEPGTLIIKAKVIKMNPGSRALRYFVGFGAGHSGADFQGEIIDAENGKVYLRFKHGRGSSIGLFGGDYEKMMIGDSKDAAEDVGKMLSKFQ